MRILFFFLCSLLLFSGCSLSQEKLVNTMNSTTLGYYQVYIISKDENQANNSNLDVDTALKDAGILPVRQVMWAWDKGKRNYTKTFNIKEYPTFLVFDTKGLVFKTTDFKHLKEFLSSTTP